MYRILTMLAVSLTMMSGNSGQAQPQVLRHQLNVFTGFSHDFHAGRNMFAEPEDPLLTAGVSFTERVFDRDKFDLSLGLEWARYGTNLTFSTRFEDQIDATRGFVPSTSELLAPMKYHFIGVPLVLQFSASNWRIISRLSPAFYVKNLGPEKDLNSSTTLVPLFHVMAGQSACYVIEMDKCNLLVGPEFTMVVNQFNSGSMRRHPYRIGCNMTWELGQ